MLTWCLLRSRVLWQWTLILNIPTPVWAYWLSGAGSGSLMLGCPPFSQEVKSFYLLCTLSQATGGYALLKQGNKARERKVWIQETRKVKGIPKDDEEKFQNNKYVYRTINLEWSGKYVSRMNKWMNEFMNVYFNYIHLFLVYSSCLANADRIIISSVIPFLLFELEKARKFCFTLNNARFQVWRASCWSLPDTSVGQVFPEGPIQSGLGQLGSKTGKSHPSIQEGGGRVLSQCSSS